MLRVEKVSKSFAGLKALDGVSLEIGAHEVVGVVGENGAGKSTLLKVLAGICRPDGGCIVLRGSEIRPRHAVDAANAGIGMVFQEPSLLPNLTVAENILLGHEQAALRAGFYDWRALNALAAAQLAKLGADIPPSALAGSLSYTERQMVELARVLALEERTRHEPVILLDEPTAMLEPAQIETILAQVERLRAHASIVFVSHRLDEVLRVCDRIYVMADGRCIAQYKRGECTVADLRRLMLGRDADEGPRERLAAGRSAVRLSVRALGRAGCYRGISFDLHAGEVLGIAGSKGSGRESLCRALFGAEEYDSGEVVLDGRPVHLREPADAVRLGIGYVPSARRTEGIVGGFSVRENMTLVQLRQLCRGPFIDLARERTLVCAWVERLRIRPGAPEMAAHHLSGGNQQKLVLAKWLAVRKPGILILDHPLCGLDAGARAEIMSLVQELARDGIGILLVADTADELIALSDSIIVMKDGCISGRFAAGAGRPSELQVLERMV